MIEAIVKPGQGPCTHPGTVAISRELASQLGKEMGDPLVMIGKRKTVGVIGSIEEMGGNVIYLGRMVGLNAQAEGKIELGALMNEVVARKVLIAIDSQGGEVDSRRMKGMLKGLYCCPGDQVGIPGSGMGSLNSGYVLKTEPDGIVQVGEETEIAVRRSFSDITSQGFDFSSIGGFRKILSSIRDLELRLVNQGVLNDYGSGSIKGVLLHGPSGVGKTLLLKSLANESKVNVFLIKASTIAGLHSEEVEKRLRSVFREAREQPPAIICIDDLDTLCTKRSDYTQPEERRALNVLLGLLDDLASESRVMVLATSREIQSIDQSLRRAGRFDKEIEISLPDADERGEILDIYCSGFQLSGDVDMVKISEMTHGFSGADLELLVKEALWNSIRRNMGGIGKDLELSSEGLKNVEVSEQDFLNAFRGINPSSGRELFAEIPKVQWEDVGGYKDAKSKLERDVIFLWKNRKKARKYGVELPRGILLYGPPGTGKTFIAKATATAVNSKVILAKASSLVSKWFGDYERNVARIFELARKVAPVVVIIDEVDSIASRRGGGIGEGGQAADRALNVLLQQLDGIDISHDIFLICITNRLDVLDEAFTRSGRIGKFIYMGKPDLDARMDIFRVHLGAMNAKVDSQVKMDELGSLTKDMVGADIKEIVRNSLANAFYEHVSSGGEGEMLVGREHLLSSIQSIRENKGNESMSFQGKG